ncbi:hypothetical protein HDU76_006236, partial [Blyttiomyces sp. JEL0837]
LQPEQLSRHQQARHLQLLTELQAYEAPETDSSDLDDTDTFYAFKGSIHDYWRWKKRLHNSLRVFKMKFVLFMNPPIRPKAPPQTASPEVREKFDKEFQLYINFDRADRLASQIILNSLTPDVAAKLKDCKTAKQRYEMLESIYGYSKMGNRLLLERTIQELKYQPGKDMNVHVMLMTQMFNAKYVDLFTPTFLNIPAKSAGGAKGKEKSSVSGSSHNHTNVGEAVHESEHLDPLTKKDLKERYESDMIIQLLISLPENSDWKGFVEGWFHKLSAEGIVRPSLKEFIAALTDFARGIKNPLPLTDGKSIGSGSGNGGGAGAVVAADGAAGDREKECRYCKKKGHLEINCKDKPENKERWNQDKATKK